MEYKESVLLQQAKKLDSKADFTIFLGIFIAGILALVALAAVIAYTNKSDWAYMAAAVVGFGYMFHCTSKASTYRVQAQMLLCQLQIERNTRPK